MKRLFVITVVLLWAMVSSAQNWLLTGNTGTTPGYTGLLNYIGTADARALAIGVNSQQAGWIDYTGYNNTFYGYLTGQASTTSGSAYYNAGLGYQVLTNNTTGGSNVGLGYQSLFNNTIGSSNVGLGYQTLYNNTMGQGNVAIGGSALLNNTFGMTNVAIGSSALAANINGGSNIGIGPQAISASQSGDGNVGIGQEALGSVNGASYNTAVGYAAGASNTGGQNDTYIGTQADNAVAGSWNNSTAIGSGAQITNNNQVVLGSTYVTQTEFNGALMPSNGYNTYSAGNANDVLTSQGPNMPPKWVTPAGGGGGSWLLLGNANTNPGYTGTLNFIGTTDAAALAIGVNSTQAGWIDYTAPANTFFGYQTGTGCTNVAGAYNNVGIGYQILTNSVAQYNNIGIGYQSLNFNAGNDNIGLGYQSLVHSAGQDNIGIGYQSVNNNFRGNDNIGIGYQAIVTNSTGSDNIGIGYQALSSSETGAGNIAMGYQALSTLIIGHGNVAYGYQSGLTNKQGSENTYVGTNADANADSWNNSTALGSGATITESNQVVIGNKAIIQTLVQAGSLSLYQSGGNNSVFFGQDQFIPSQNPYSVGSWGIQYVPASQNAGGMGGLNFWKPYINGILNNYGTGYVNGFLWLNDNGNVGIGTTTPASALDVHSVAPYAGQVANFRNGNSDVFVVSAMPAPADWSYLSQIGDNGIFWADNPANGNHNSGFVIAPWSLSTAGIRMDASGNVGVGASNPNAQVDIQVPHTATLPAFSVSDYTGKQLVIIDPTGKVVIGDSIINPANYPNHYGLYVSKGILSSYVKIALPTGANWADYVFADDYKLKSLIEVAQYIKENKHLPDVPSAEDVKKNGIDVGEMDATMMRKMEELTLYILQQQKQIKDLQDQVNKLSNK